MCLCTLTARLFDLLFARMVACICISLQGMRCSKEAGSAPVLWSGLVWQQGVCWLLWEAPVGTVAVLGLCSAADGKGYKEYLLVHASYACGGSGCQQPMGGAAAVNIHCDVRCRAVFELYDGIDYTMEV